MTLFNTVFNIEFSVKERKSAVPYLIIWGWFQDKLIYTDPHEVFKACLINDLGLHSIFSI